MLTLSIKILWVSKIMFNQFIIQFYKGVKVIGHSVFFQRKIS